MRINVVIWFLLLCLTACHRQPDYPSVLLLADSLANENADGALTILSGLESDMAEEPEATQMYYQLLCIKASDKAYITHTSDSLILPVLNFFEKVEDQSLLGEVYYYAGRVYRDLGNIPRALDYFHKSLEAGGADNNPALYAQLGEIYFSQSLFPEAITMYKEAFRLDSARNDTIGIILDLRDIAFAHRMLNKNDSALHFYQQAESLAKESRNREMKSLIAAQLAALYNRMGNTNKALTQIAQAMPEAGEADKYSMADIYANILLANGNLIEAEEKYLLMTESNDLNIRLDAYNGLATIAGLRNSPDAYLSYFGLYKACNDSLKRIAATETVSRMNAMYNYQQQEKENAKLKMQNQQRLLFIICVLCLFVVLVAILFAYFQYRRLNMKKRLIHVERSLREHLEKEFKQEQKARIEKAVRDSAIMKKLEESIANERPLTEEDVSSIEQLLNEISPSFLPLLKDLGNMTPIEHQVCLLLKLNLTPVQISGLVLRDKSSVASIRRRLFKKITGQDGTPGDLDNIIHSL